MNRRLEGFSTRPKLLQNLAEKKVLQGTLQKQIKMVAGFLLKEMCLSSFLGILHEISSYWDVDVKIDIEIELGVDIIRYDLKSPKPLTDIVASAPTKLLANTTGSAQTPCKNTLLKRPTVAIPTFCATRTSKKVTKTRPVTEPEVCFNGPCFSQTEAPKKDEWIIKPQLLVRKKHSTTKKLQTKMKNHHDIHLNWHFYSRFWNLEISSKKRWMFFRFSLEAVAQGSIQPSHITKPGRTTIRWDGGQ